MERRPGARLATDEEVTRLTTHLMSENRRLRAALTEAIVYIEYDNEGAFTRRLRAALGPEQGVKENG